MLDWYSYFRLQRHKQIIVITRAGTIRLTHDSIRFDSNEYSYDLNRYDSNIFASNLKVRSVPEKLFSLIIEIGRQKYVQSCIFTR